MSTNTLIPTHCPSCHSKVKVDGIHLICDNPKCNEQVVQKITHWAKNCEMDGVAESGIRSLVDAGKISSVRDLYNLTEKSLDGLAGWGESRIANLLDQLESTKEMSIGQFVDRLGVDLVGEKAMTKMGIKSVADLWAFKDTTYVIGQNLVEYLNENKDFVKDLLSVIVIKAPKTAAKGARSIALTGTGPKGRKELADEIAAKGDVFVDSVGKDTDILLCEDTNGSSSKLTKATKMGVKLMTYEEYFK